MYHFSLERQGPAEDCPGPNELGCYRSAVSAMKRPRPLKWQHPKCPLWVRNRRFYLSAKSSAIEGEAVIYGYSVSVDRCYRKNGRHVGAVKSTVSSRGC